MKNCCIQKSLNLILEGPIDNKFSTSLGIALVPNRRQAITWSTVIQWMGSSSLGVDAPGPVPVSDKTV